MSRFAKLLALSGCTLLLGWMLFQIYGKAGTEQFKLDDFVSYWAAGRLVLQDGNPYSGQEMYALQRSIGWVEPIPLMVWYPPWFLVLAMPFGALPYALGRLVWLLLNLGLLVGAAELLWRVYGGRPRTHGVSIVICAIFYPVVSQLRVGNSGLLIGIGIAAFLYFGRRGRWTAAGAALALVATKPQLVFLLWPVLLLWVWRSRIWSVLGGLAGALVAALLVVAALDPAIVTQYVAGALAKPPLFFETPTLGTLLRLAFGWQHRWLQFVPALFGFGWLLIHWRRNAEHWDWTRHTPLLMLVSLVTTPFAWAHDPVVLLPAIVQVAVWVLYGFIADTPLLRKAALVTYLSINAVAYAMDALLFNIIWFVWMPSALLVIYLVFHHLTQTLPSSTVRTVSIRLAN